MTRRAASRLAGLLPVLLIVVALVVVATAAGVAACGGSSGGPTPALSPTSTGGVTPSATAAPPAASPSATTAVTSLTIYFVRGDALGTATRQVPATAAIATAALNALLSGPSAAEQEAGLSTNIPAGVRLKGLTISGGVATVDLSSPIAAKAAGAVATRRLAQVVYTLTQFPTVKRTVITVNGSPLTSVPGGVPGSPEPLTFASPQRRGYDPWNLVLPGIFVEQPGVGAVLSSPFTLTGTARVFEGSFTARLLDSSGRRIVNVTVQATRGAPGRGSFRRSIAFSTSATRGTLVVYSQSMEDGSRQNLVSIPVTFAH